MLDDLAARQLARRRALGVAHPALAEPVHPRRRAYGEALLPIGLVVAGRTGDQWGLGMLTNGGDCADCDNGDVADRIALITPIVGQIFALATTSARTGPLVPRAEQRAAGGRRRPPSTCAQRDLRVAPLEDDPGALVRRRKAGEDDVRLRRLRALPLAAARPPGELPRTSPCPCAVEHRAGDGAWLPRRRPSTAGARLMRPRLGGRGRGARCCRAGRPASLDARRALRHARSPPFSSACAMESDFGAARGAVPVRARRRLRERQPAPGFGALPPAERRAAREAGRLRRAAGQPAVRHARVNNFRFAAGLQIDRILFREIIGP